MLQFFLKKIKVAFWHGSCDDSVSVLFHDRATSATSHVVLGQFKTCVIMLGGYLFFNSEPGMVSLCGAVVALCGMSLYTLLSLQLLQEPTNSKQLLPRQASLPSKPKADAENGKIDPESTDSV